MRLIDADAMLETLNRKYPQWYTGKPKDHLMHYVCLVYYWAVRDAPTADAAPVRHGRWIEYGENKDGTHNICCSVCDGFFKSKGHANSCYTRNKYRYCHNCGARMDGESDEID